MRRTDVSHGQMKNPQQLLGRKWHRRVFTLRLRFAASRRLHLRAFRPSRHYIPKAGSGCGRG
jgi:hypothetical protein